MKHPISHEEAWAFANKYIDAPDDVFTAQFVFRCELDRAYGPEDARAKLETSYRINQAMDQLTTQRHDIIRDAIEYLDLEREEES